MAPTRVLLKKLLVGPIVMTPLPGKTGYRFDGKMRLDELLAVGGAVSVASPRERSEMYKRLRGRFPLAALARI